MDATESRQALWREFCERLAYAGRVMERSTLPTDELTLAEGYRHLARLIRIGFELSFEYADPLHPQIVPMASSTMLTEGVTPDARYHHALIDGQGIYRVTGTRGEAPLIEFTVYAGKIGLDDTSRQIGGRIETELAVSADGRFALVISPDEQPGNWIRSEPDASYLFIRQYAHDWSRTKGAGFEIEREGPAEALSPLRLERIREALFRTASFVDKAAQFWTSIVERRAGLEPNRFYEIPADPDPTRPTMPVGHRFAAGYFRLGPDEALVVEFQPTSVPYWGLDLTNAWFEPISWDDPECHTNNHRVTYALDGSVRIVISNEPCGAQNWINLADHREGTILFRWSRSEDPPPELHTRVVKLSDL